MEFQLRLTDWALLNPAHCTLEEPSEMSVEQVKSLDLSELKPMQRRRLSKYAKMSLSTVYQLSTKLDDDCSIVFASRHGDFHRTKTLLQTLAENDNLSPTSFSLSVHNACMGLYSIFTDFKGPITTVSAGKETFQSALVESAIRLNTQTTKKVLLIYVDQVLPEDYQHFADQQQIDHCLVLLLEAQNDEGEVQIRVSKRESNEPDSFEPASLGFAEWLASSEIAYQYHIQHFSWAFNKCG